MTTTWRYWGWLVLKLVAATALTAIMYWSLQINGHFARVQPTFDGILFGFWILPMVWVGLVWAAIYDQRFRCRTCARRLRMPVEHGSYSALLLNHPGIEYICPYGHGKLLVEVWLANEQSPKWTTYGNLWQELFRKSKADHEG
jgi:hypothetical protein